MAILVLMEHDGARVSETAAKALGAITSLGSADVLVAGSGCAAAADHAATLAGVGKVLLLDGAAYGEAMAETYAAALADLADRYDHIVAPATASGKNIMARLAGLLDVMILSDVTTVIDADTFERPVYAGNAMMTVRSRDTKKVITIRTAPFAAAADGAGPAPVESVSGPDASPLSRFVGADMTQSDRPELATAKSVVSGGRGVGSAENFALIQGVADKIGAAVGASRAAVDSGYAPNDWQVGPTGKVVAPDLYMAVGISGAIQHLAGMKDSKVIVAINKDEEAPIFQVADYGLVGDLFAVLPELEGKL